MTPPAPRVLMAGSLPLAAPWNGADKVLARTIVNADPFHRYIVETGPDDQWPGHVTPVREVAPPSLPSRLSELRAGLFVARNSHGCVLIHLVASLRRSPAGPARLLRAWSRLSSRPIVHSLPGISTETVDPGALVGDVTVVFSEHTKELLEAAGVANVVRIFPPVDLPRLASPVAPEELRTRWELGPRAVLYSAHLDEGNGMEHAIQAFAALPPELDDATLVLAPRWRTHQDPEPELARLRGTAATHGVAGRVRWVTGITDMPALLSACAVTVLVPRSLRGKMDLPMVLLESLALGRPIVVTDRTPIREALLGGGLEVPYADPRQLAAALSALLSDEVRRTELAETGRSNVMALADPARAAATYASIYERVLKVRAHRAEVTND